MLAHSAAAAAAAAAGSSKGKASGKKGKGSDNQGQQALLQAPFVSAAGVLALLDACLEVTGSMKGSVSGVWQQGLQQLEAGVTRNLIRLRCDRQGRDSSSGSTYKHQHAAVTRVLALQGC
jgi:hypothetical protein